MLLFVSESMKYLLKLCQATWFKLHMLTELDVSLEMTAIYPGLPKPKKFQVKHPHATDLYKHCTCRSFHESVGRLKTLSRKSSTVLSLCFNVLIYWLVRVFGHSESMCEIYACFTAEKLKLKDLQRNCC